MVTDTMPPKLKEEMQRKKDIVHTFLEGAPIKRLRKTHGDAERVIRDELQWAGTTAVMAIQGVKHMHDLLMQMANAQEDSTDPRAWFRYIRMGEAYAFMLAMRATGTLHNRLQSLRALYEAGKM